MNVSVGGLAGWCWSSWVVVTRRWESCIWYWWTRHLHHNAQTPPVSRRSGPRGSRDVAGCTLCRHPGSLPTHTHTHTHMQTDRQTEISDVGSFSTKVWIWLAEYKHVLLIFTAYNTRLRFHLGLYRHCRTLIGSHNLPVKRNHRCAAPTTKGWKPKAWIGFFGLVSPHPTTWRFGERCKLLRRGSR